MTDRSVMLVTGSRKGIGRYLCEYYLEKGYQVVGCSRGESDLTNPDYRHVTLDVANEAEARQLFSLIRKEYGRLDVLVNNAGTGSLNHSLVTPVETVRRILETNVVGCFLFSREAAKLMKAKRFGRIVNFSSVTVPFRMEGEAIYVASKAAVMALTEVLAREYADFGISVNAVAPPAVETDLIKDVPRSKVEQMLQRQAIHRCGGMDEICNVIDFFIDPGNQIVTGQTIFMGGL